MSEPSAPKIVSADSHVLEPHDLWTRRLAGTRFADRAPKMEGNAEDGYVFQIDGLPPFPIGLAGAARFDSTGSLTGVGGAFEAGTRLDSSGSLAAFGNAASSFPAAGGRGGSVGDFGGYASGDVARSGADTDGGLNARGGVDGVRATYQLLAQREAGRLTEATAPRLHEYLARREKGGNARGGGGNARGERDAERADEEMRDEGPGENAPFSP